MLEPDLLVRVRVRGKARVRVRARARVRVGNRDLLGEQLAEQGGPARRGLRRVLRRRRALVPLGPPG